MRLAAQRTRTVGTLTDVAAGEDVTFAMDRLVAYDDASIITEIQRVASLIAQSVITRDAFDDLSRVTSGTCIRRFGSWQAALERAGLPSRYGGKRVSPKMRDQRARTLTAEQVKEELQRVAEVVGRRQISRHDVLAHSDVMGERVVLNRFGSWKVALEAAGLEPTPFGRRWTDQDYFENLLEVWTHYGRVPTFAEMRSAPSRITPSGYAKKFGSWGRAKAAFVERINADLVPAADATRSQPSAPVPVPTAAALKAEDRREIPLGLRYAVLRRDRFRCGTCGRSPATTLDCTLHVDHIVPFSKGGKTTTENLRTLCDACNLGKSDGPA